MSGEKGRLAYSNLRRILRVARITPDPRHRVSHLSYEIFRVSSARSTMRAAMSFHV